MPRLNDLLKTLELNQIIERSRGIVVEKSKRGKSVKPYQQFQDKKEHIYYQQQRTRGKGYQSR